MLRRGSEMQFSRKMNVHYGNVQWFYNHTTNYALVYKKYAIISRKLSVVLYAKMDINPENTQSYHQQFYDTMKLPVVLRAKTSILKTRNDVVIIPSAILWYLKRSIGSLTSYVSCLFFSWRCCKSQKHLPSDEEPRYIWPLPTTQPREFQDI